MIGIHEIAVSYNEKQRRDAEEEHYEYTVDDNICVGDFDEDSNTGTLFYRQHCFAKVNTDQKTMHTTVYVIDSRSICPIEKDFLEYVGNFKGYTISTCDRKYELNEWYRINFDHGRYSYGQLTGVSNHDGELHGDFIMSSNVYASDSNDHMMINLNNDKIIRKASKDECALEVINHEIDAMMGLLNVITQNYSCMLQNKMQEFKKTQCFDTDDAHKMFNLTRMVDRCDAMYERLQELRYYSTDEETNESE